MLKRDLGGTVRQCSASETLSRVRPLLPALGITRLANITGLDRIGVEVWTCVRPNGRCLSVSLGKGITAELAQVSAVMESIELHHAEQTAEPELVATARAARRRCAIVDPQELRPGIRWSGYRGTRAIAWIRGTDIANDEPVLVPHAWVDEDLSRLHPDAGLFLTTSTGLAAGNHRLEALNHALFEVIERDSEWRFMRQSESARQARQLDIDSIDVPMLSRMLTRIERVGLEVAIWDITSAIGIPAYGCSLTDLAAVQGINPSYGSGCHLSKIIALSRAITEAVQCRVGAIAGTRDDLFPAIYEAARLAGPRNRRRPGRVDFRTRQAVPEGDTFENDLEITLQRLRTAGFPRVIAIDHTRPEFGIPVVFVVVPGMFDVE